MTDRTQKAGVIADVIARRHYGVALKHVGEFRFPELIKDGLAIVKALERAEKELKSVKRPSRKRRYDRETGTCRTYR